jgi:hypothetical protein
VTPLLCNLLLFPRSKQKYGLHLICRGSAVITLLSTVPFDANVDRVVWHSPKDMISVVRMLTTFAERLKTVAA